jgi:predicted component of type VI protein secretion system
MAQQQSDKGERKTRVQLHSESTTNRCDTEGRSNAEKIQVGWLSHPKDFAS